MNRMEFAVPCLFGLEGIAGDELRRLKLDNVRVENGRVLFSGDETAMAKANVCLRTGERVLLVLADFEAKTFEHLFQGVYRANLEDYIPKDGAFPVKGHCLNSQLMSVPDCQAIVKKAASRRLGEKYGVSWLPETGVKYQLQFSVMNDRVTLYLDTTGPGLHKRGYRAVGNDAPLRETLAAAMVQLTRYRGREFFWDPFCGSGTIAIEAAMIATRRAPGLDRAFAGEAFARLPEPLWREAREAARAQILTDSHFEAYASDIDEDILDLTYENALRAGVENHLNIFQADARDIKRLDWRGTVICNPPYGERMGERQEIQELYRQMGKAFRSLDPWQIYILTSCDRFEKLYGRQADRVKRLYNGMIPCFLYEYYKPQDSRSGDKNRDRGGHPGNMHSKK